MKKIAVISLSLLLAACGYSPLYKEGGPSATSSIAQLEQIEIAPMKDRLGQEMQNRLLDLLGGTATPNYTLNITLDAKIEGYGFRPDAAVTQEQVTVTAYVQLTDNRDESVAFTTTITDRTSYDVVLSDFATVTQRDDAKRRLVRELSDQLHRRLALHFREQ